MILKKSIDNIAFLSTYPPRECGLATFTQDLINSIDDIGIVNTNVIAIKNSKKNVYDSKVFAEIRQNELEDYIKTAKRLNASNIDLLVIEHEYGIFGGEYGDYILKLVEKLEIPIITTLHTILSKPDFKQRLIINILGKKSVKIITMAKNTKKILQKTYGIDSRKIEVIHHGVPRKLIISKESAKKKYGYENTQIVSTFGLIGPGKGIEHAIEAISEVVKTQKDLIYLILGQTHPALKDKGRTYRNKLEKQVKRLNLGENVKFINKYLSKDEIIQYLQLSDIYMTPYLNVDQAVSGTLAYAVGYGKAIVSTPYLYAKEMLADGRGVLAEFNNVGSLVNGLKHILQNPDEKVNMEKTTIKMGRTMYWEIVAQKYNEVFLNSINSYANAKLVSSDIEVV
ncbi:MAG: glycosyltransferase family 4 protein [Clostridiales bacterium]